MADVGFLPGGSSVRIVGAEGAYLIDGQGRRIFDAAGGAVVANIGYGRREVAEVARASLERIGYVVPTFVTPEREALVERLRSRWLPSELSRVFLCSGGSESVDSAIRIARQYHVAAGRPDKWRVIGLDPSYHGITVASASAGAHHRRRAGLGPLLLDFPKVAVRLDPDRPHLGFDQGSAADHVAALERVLHAAGPDTVAAFIAEPVGGAASGCAIAPPGYWEGVMELCHRHDVLVIADEVMCGLGRTGHRWGIEHHGVVPDLMVGGKGLGGGYVPIGGGYATSAVAEALARAGSELMFFTFSASNVACAVAERVLDILEREDLVARAAAAGKRLRDALDATFADHPHVADVRGLGLLQGIELVADRDTLTPFAPERRVTNAVVSAGLRRGFWFYPAGSGEPADCILLGPPFITTDEEIDRLVEALAASIDDATR